MKSKVREVVFHRRPRLFQYDWSFFRSLLTRRGRKGFSLLEVLISSALTVLILTGLCQGLALTLAAYSFSQRSWQASLDLWNQANRFLAGQGVVESAFYPSPESHRIERVRITSGKGAGKTTWEVLRAE